MKIENKVQANIIANNNEEAVKVLLADYERKIKALEKIKKQHAQLRQSEMKQLEHMNEEKRRLNERLHALQLKRFKSFSSKVNLAEGFCWQEVNRFGQLLHLEKAGNIDVLPPAHDGNHCLIQSPTKHGQLEIENQGLANMCAELVQQVKMLRNQLVVDKEGTSKEVNRLKTTCQRMQTSLGTA